MTRKNVAFPSVIFGLSPLGGNANEGSGTIEGVPLHYDQRVGAYISEQASEELTDRDIGIEQRQALEEE